MSGTTPHREIRAAYDAETIRVYQAYSTSIASAALKAGTLVPPFRRDRMTWIKPSFLWMMYRCGWSYKDAGQRHVLGLDIKREGFEAALGQASLSHSAAVDGHKPPVRVQWDPERGLRLERLEYRSIQVGLSAGAVNAYVDDWIVGITDLTELAREIHALVEAGQLEPARALLPKERPYELPAPLHAKLCNPTED